MLSSIFNDFISFCFTPSLVERSAFTRSKKIVYTFIFVIFAVLLHLAIVIINHLLFKFHKPVAISSYHDNSILFISLYAMIIRPVIEELGFRLPLRFSISNVCMSFCTILFFLISRYYYHDTILNVSTLFQKIIIVIVPGIILFFIIKRYVDNFEKFWHNNFVFIVYFFSLFFGFMHLSSTFIASDILLIIGHTLSGLIYSFSRVQFGLGYSILAHSLNNGIAIVVPRLLLT